MGDMDAVIDAPVAEDVELDNPGEVSTEPEGGDPVSSAAADGEPQAAKDDPYTTKYAREMRAALKAWEQANPEAAKFTKQIRDNHARLFALNQIDPSGINGVRETYSLLDSMIHGDLKGREAVTAMQDALAKTEQIDEMLASGNPKVLDAFDEGFNQGFAKLAPALLDRVRSSDPQAFEGVIAPHVAETLASSPLVKDYNAIVEVLNTFNDPRLDEKTKLRLVTDSMGRIGEWLGQQIQKAGQSPAPQQAAAANPVDEQRAQFEQEQQKFHWDTKIQPQVAQYENSKFEELFKPYGSRLKLDATAKADLLDAFKRGLSRLGSQDAEYMRQVQRYRSQRNPDPTTVTNYVKNAVNKHSKNVMESLIKARYGAFLNGKPKPAATASQNGKPMPPAGPGVEIRTVKPPMHEIDHRNTPVEWLAMKKYRLTSGKVIQVRPN